MAFDIIIKNCKIIDGTGNPWYPGEIGIKDGKIVKIRPKLNENAIREIDATGLNVCPGFIDTHSHTDTMLPIYSKMDTFIRQGITTAVCGMCGDGMAPIPKEKFDVFRDYFNNIALMGGEIKITWNTFEEYFTETDKLKIPSNLVFFVGFANIRIAGGPAFENRPSTSQELEKMKEYTTEAMKAGAFGMSTGLVYAPQIFSKTEEIIELAKVVAKYNGLYFSHIRDQGRKLIESVKEAIEIVEKSGCIGGQISHHKVAGKKFWGASKETLCLIEEANARGVNITCDQYPYNRSESGLMTTFPPQFREGTDKQIVERLKKIENQKYIKEAIIADKGDWENWIVNSGFDHIFPSYFKSEKWKDVEGKSITEIAKIKGKDVWEAYFEILIDENAQVIITVESMGEEDIRRIMTSRYQMFTTDGRGVPHIPNLKIFHPRYYGTYPRVLGKYVREEKILTLENAIRKMTSFPAQRLGLRDRGLIRENTWADIVMFDPEKVSDKANYIEPHQFPEGIVHVIVNGTIVVENEKQLRKYPGKVLKRAN